LSALPDWAAAAAAGTGGCCALERWRPVPGWPHEASTCGRVRTITRIDRRGRLRLPVVLAPSPDRRPGKGYLYVVLVDGERRRKAPVHVLVLEAWAGPKPSPQHEGCHGNDVRTDNHLGNLRWDTRRGNLADRARRLRPVTPNPANRDETGGQASQARCFPRKTPSARGVTAGVTGDASHGTGSLLPHAVSRYLHMTARTLYLTARNRWFG